MLDLDQIARLNVTTQALVERCAASRDSPFATLEDSLAKLANSPDWCEGEIEQIRRAATLLIAGSGLLKVTPAVKGS